MREVIGYTYKDKLGNNIFLIVLFSAFFGFAFFLLNKVTENSKMLLMLLTIPVLIFYFIYDLFRISWLPNECIVHKDDSLIIFFSKSKCQTVKIKDISDLSLKNARGRNLTYNYGSLFIKTNKYEYEIPCVRDLEQTKSKLLKLMLEYKNEHR